MGKDGVIVPKDKLTSTAEVMEGLATSADQIADAVQDADPPAILWGPLGLFVKGDYDAKSAEAKDHIRMIGEALTSQGGAIHAAVKAHDEVDAALEAAFKRFQDKITGSGS